MPSGFRDHREIAEYFKRCFNKSGTHEIRTGWRLPTVVGHADKVKMWNIEGRYFDETAEEIKAAVVTEALMLLLEAQLVKREATRQAVDMLVSASLIQQAAAEES